MDVDKAIGSNVVTYRMNKQTRRVSHELLYSIKEMGFEGFKPEIDTLTYLGMLWASTKLDDMDQKPRTRAEKAYMYAFESKLDALLKESEYGNAHINSELYGEIRVRIKHLLAAVHFNQLTEDYLRTINASKFKDVMDFTDTGVR